MGSYVSSSCRAFSFSFIGRTMSKGGPHWFQETNGEWYMARLMSRDCGEVCFNCSETKRVTGWPPWPMPCEMGTGHGGQHYCRWCDRSGGARAAAAAPKRAAAPASAPATSSSAIIAAITSAMTATSISSSHASAPAPATSTASTATAASAPATSSSAPMPTAAALAADPESGWNPDPYWNCPYCGEYAACVCPRE